MKRPLLFLTAVLLSVPLLAQNPESEELVTFRFVPGDDMFYIPWEGNGEQLGLLYSVIDRYRLEISSGAVPVYVDGYGPTKNLSFIRANRVKSELILHKGLTEDNFVTKNFASAYTAPDGTEYRDMVVVTLRIPAKPEPAPKPAVKEPKPVVREEQDPPAEDAPFTKVEPEPEPPHVPIASTTYKGWYVGADIGMPFFWGDFLSTAAEKTYIGFSAGIYGGYQLNSWLGIKISLDYAVNKTGHRDYAAGYLLDPTGMTYYTPQSGTTKRYDELYGKINMFSVGLHADLNANRIFGRRAAGFPLKLIVSPAVYANTFSPKIYTIDGDEKYVTHNQSQKISLGLGGDVALRYDIDMRIGVQVKGTGMWITDNLFDNIRTVGHVKQNAICGVSAGVVWKIESKKQ